MHLGHIRFCRYDKISLLRREGYGVKTAVVIVHIFLAVALIFAVMVQGRKSSHFSGIFGGGTIADMSGGQRKKLPLLTKVTAALGAAFMFTAFLMAFYR